MFSLVSHNASFTQASQSQRIDHNVVRLLVQTITSVAEKKKQILFNSTLNFQKHCLNERLARCNYSAIDKSVAKFEPIQTQSLVASVLRL